MAACGSVKGEIKIELLLSARSYAAYTRGSTLSQVLGTFLLGVKYVKSITVLQSLQSSWMVQIEILNKP